MDEAEAATVRAFIARNRQDRWLSGLASRKKRQEILNRLHDGHDLRDDVAETFQGDLPSLQAELRRRGAPDICQVLGGDLDGEARPLGEAIQSAVDAYGGVLLVCVPGSLAVHFPEAPAEPSILSK